MDYAHGRSVYSIEEWEENEMQWHALASAWKERAEKAEATAALLLAALEEASGAMNRLGDELNDRDYDAGESDHYEQTCFAFEAVRAALEEVS